MAGAGSYSHPRGRPADPSRRDPPTEACCSSTSYRRNVLERLRRPFEERRLTVARGSVAAEPASVRELSVFCP
jgi:hypothetical protein